MKGIGQAFVSLIVCALLALPAVAQQPVPALRQQVTDLTNTLTADQINTLKTKLQAIETQRGSQIAILLVPTTAPEEIEQYSIRVVEQWKIGRGKVDDGILVLLAMNDHRARIEVGDGLEGLVPDAKASRIIREILTPQLREKRVYEGLAAVVDALDALLSGATELPAPTGVAKQPHFDPFVLLMLPLIIGSVLRAMFGRLGGSILAGLLAVIVGSMAGMLGVGILVGIGVALFVLLAPDSPVQRSYWSGGGFGSGGGFSSGGGGWSGGGGRFSGGGASGSW